MVRGAKIWNFQLIDSVFHFLPNAGEQLRAWSPSKENQGSRLPNPRQVISVATNTILYLITLRARLIYDMRVSYVRSKDAHKMSTPQIS